MTISNEPTAEAWARTRGAVPAPSPAGADCAQCGDDPLDAVRGPHRDPVPGFDPVGDHGACGGGHLVGEPVERPAGDGAGRPVEVDDRLRTPEPGRGVLDQAGERPPLQVPPGIGHI